MSITATGWTKINGVSTPRRVARRSRLRLIRRKKARVAWDEDSEARLNRIPYFLRAMVKKGVEKHARENSIPLITIELMEELRKKRFGNETPVFKF